jgi:hypothetical protein
MADDIIRPPPHDTSIARTVKKVGALPAGRTLETDPNSWYYLRANFRIKSLPYDAWYISRARTPPRRPEDKDVVVFDWRTNFALQFSPQPHEEEPGWQVWKIRDGDGLSGTYLDRKDQSFLCWGSGVDAAFRIIDDELYCGQWGTNVGYYQHDVIYLVPAFRPFTCELVKVS